MGLYPEFERVYLAANVSAKGEEPTKCVILRGRDIVVQPLPTEEESGVALVDGEVATKLELTAKLLGRYAGVTYMATMMSAETPLPEHLTTLDLRGLYGRVSDVEWHIAGYASQIFHWEKTSAYCPVCGHATEPMAQEWMRKCAQCGHIRYPQVSPAVLVLVHDGADRVLLAHKPGWGDRYSILAGFVLPEESLEECVAREVEEEVGVQITDIVYEGSQPWPFPHQLMVGFTARYTGGDIRLDEEELDDARWFSANALPSLPPPLSLSRQIIDRWQKLHG